MNGSGFTALDYVPWTGGDWWRLVPGFSHGFNAV